MSFSPQAADCYSLLKSGSLLSACAVIENFLPPSHSRPPTPLLCFPLAPAILVSRCDISDFPSPPTNSLSLIFSLAPSLLFLPV